MEQRIVDYATKGKAPDYRPSKQTEIPEVTTIIGHLGHKNTRTDHVEFSTCADVIQTQKNGRGDVSGARSKLKGERGM